jgi:hypothetical protein
MTFDLKRIIEAERAHRRELAMRPIAEKLAMLDALRERALVLRGARRSDAVAEGPGEYRARTRPLIS